MEVFIFFMGLQPNLIMGSVWNQKIHFAITVEVSADPSKSWLSRPKGKFGFCYELTVFVVKSAVFIWKINSGSMKGGDREGRFFCFHSKGIFLLFVSNIDLSKLYHISNLHISSS